MRFVGSNFAIITEKPICRLSKQDTSLQTSITAMVFNETTNYGFILVNKTRQRHIETRAANVWELKLTQKSELKTLTCH